MFEQVKIRDFNLVIEKTKWKACYLLLPLYDEKQGAGVLQLNLPVNSATENVLCSLVVYSLCGMKGTQLQTTLRACRNPSGPRQNVALWFSRFSNSFE